VTEQPPPEVPSNLSPAQRQAAVRAALRGVARFRGPPTDKGGLPVNVLILGDSISRFVVEDYSQAVRCKERGRVFDWSHGALRYMNRQGASPSLACVLPPPINSTGDGRHGPSSRSLGFLHLYGNAPSGPYPLRRTINDHDPNNSGPLTEIYLYVLGKRSAE
jgi:hypothetical protein